MQTNVPFTSIGELAWLISLAGKAACDQDLVTSDKHDWDVWDRGFSLENKTLSFRAWHSLAKALKFLRMNEHNSESYVWNKSNV